MDNADQALMRGVVAERLAHAHAAITRTEMAAVELSPTERVEADMRALAAQHPPVASGLSLYTAGMAQVQIDDRGQPLNEPTGSPRELLKRWRTDPTRWAAAPCGEAYNRFALALGDAGWEWLNQVCGMDRKTARKRREDAELLALGVPVQGGKGVHAQAYRDPQAAPVMLMEPRPATPMARVTVLPVTDSAEDFHQATMAAIGQRSQRAERWLVWDWPAGWKMPQGRVREGVYALAALPVNDAVLEVAGVQLRVMNFARPFGPVPEWLCQALGGKREKVAS